MKPPEFVAVRVGFADFYKVGLWTPIEVTIRGGSLPEIGRVRASVADNDDLNCSFDAPAPCQVLPGQETKVVLYVRFGHEESTLSLELLGESTTLARKTFNSDQSPASDQFPDALSHGQRLIVSVGRGSIGLEKTAASSPGEGVKSRNVVATVDSLGRLPTRWHGYEGVDIVVVSTSDPQVFEKVPRNSDRIEALEEWVRAGGTLVLCAAPMPTRPSAATRPWRGSSREVSTRPWF